MFIELLDFLRCPRAHEESWLVLAAQATDGRDIMEGTLGCPICRAEYPIVGGVARFALRSADAETERPDAEEALRLAATLDLTGTRGYAVLIGRWGNHAPLLLTMTDVQLMLVNPPPTIGMGHGVSGLTVEEHWAALPLAAASARAIALDETTSLVQLAAALEVVAAGGRVVGPVSLALPEGATELARDDRYWVAEQAQKPASSGIVSLRRRS
jgi:uncharacterized protein YbaR (Trm112 family)